MKIFKITVLVILGLILVLFLGSLLLPSEFHVERKLEIKSNARQAFKQVNNLRLWKDWSPWLRLDSNIQITYNEIEEGKGAGYSWKSTHKDVGNGSMLILNSVPDSLVEVELNFGEMGSSVAGFHFTEMEHAIMVSWTLDGQSGDLPIWFRPISKYFYLMMDQMVGPDFEKGLRNLQQILESQPTLQIGNFEAEVRDFQGMHYIGIRNKLKGAEISAKLGEYYGQLQQELKRQNIPMSGVPFTINYSANGDLYDMQAALQTPVELICSKPVVSGNLPAGKWLVVKYYGSYEAISPMYMKGFEYLAQNNLKPSGAPMEFYFTDPYTESDTSKWLTEIVFPFIP